MARVKGLLLFGLTALALAGCSSTSAAPPPVKLDDLNVQPYMDKPCTLLDADQRSNLGITGPGVAEQSGDFGTCALPTPTGTVRLTVAVKRPKYPSTPIKIAGYPAEETTSDIGCAVGVQVAGTQQIGVVAAGPNTNSCHLAENVATSAIGTIKRNNP
ncbi:DUF3558 family protein [Kutzneria buriramensis]|uniref:Uncharacterized protein DUF3558 n=1 Tax=Kutzneria buriramensis TaxID=1045776 RepID=A0A3E0HZS0_9PSEU|nr:uncharacterized protein DUF3558 [Kutzneria buriramensis]